MIVAPPTLVAIAPPAAALAMLDRLGVIGRGDLDCRPQYGLFEASANESQIGSELMKTKATDRRTWIWRDDVEAFRRGALG